MRRLEVVIVAVMGACGGAKPARVPTTARPVAKNPSLTHACAPDPSRVQEIEAARAANDIYGALDKAQALDASCPSPAATWQLAESYAFAWRAGESRAAYQRYLAAVPQDTERVNRALAKLDSITALRQWLALDAKEQESVKHLTRNANIDELSKRYSEAATGYEKAFAITGDPRLLALVGRMYDKTHDTVQATLWYARALALAEAAAKGSVSARLSTGYADDVRALAFSPDGKQLAIASSDGYVRLWDGERGDIVFTASAFKDAVTSVTFNANGSLLAAGSRDGTAKVFDVAGGRESLSIDVRVGINAVAFAPDGQLATAGEGGVIRMWNPGDGTRIRVLPGLSAEIFSLAFSPPNRNCSATGSDPTASLTGHHDVKDAPVFLAAATSNGTVEVWSIEHGRQKQEGTYDVNAWDTRSVSFSHDGKLLSAAGSDGTVIFETCKPGWPHRTIAKHHYRANATAFNADDTIVADTSADPIPAPAPGQPSPGDRFMVELLSLRTRHSAAPDTDFPDSINALVAHPTSPAMFAAGADDGSVRILVAGKEPITISNPAAVPWDLDVTSDGRTLVMCGADRHVTRWRLDTGERASVLDFDDTVTHCRLDRSNKLVAAIGGKQLKVVELATGKSVATIKPSCMPTAVALADDGRHAYLGCGNGTLSVWDIGASPPVQVASVDAKQPVHHTASISDIRVLPQGDVVLTASDDKTVHAWDAKSLAPSGAALTGLKTAIAAISVSQDGRLVAVGSGDEEIKVFDLKTGALAKQLVGHRKVERLEKVDYSVRSLAFAPDGKRLVSMGWDRTMRAWDLASGTGTIVEHMASPGRSIVFRADGKLAFAMQRDGRISLYRVGTDGFQLLGTLFGAGNDWVAADTTGHVDASPEHADGKAGGRRFVTWSVGSTDLEYYVAWARQVRPGLLGQMLAL